VIASQRQLSENRKNGTIDHHSGRFIVLSVGPFDAKGAPGHCHRRGRVDCPRRLEAELR
jgi:hypothetical protein